MKNLVHFENNVEIFCSKIIRDVDGPRESFAEYVTTDLEPNAAMKTEPKRSLEATFIPGPEPNMESVQVKNEMKAGAQLI